MHAMTPTSLPIYWLASSMARLDYSGLYMINLQLFLVDMHCWPRQPGNSYTDFLGFLALLNLCVGIFIYKK